MNRPNSCTNLIKAINRIAGSSRDSLRMSRALANVIVAQMLPDGVVKGGSSLMFRYGEDSTRYTRDMDTARVMPLDRYLDVLERNLNVGWNGFIRLRKSSMQLLPKARIVLTIWSIFSLYAGCRR